MLAPEIAVRDGDSSTTRISTRCYSATYRHYRYHVVNTPMPNPLMARSVWHVYQPLQLWTMQLACDPLIGEHDFSAFPPPAAGLPAGKSNT